MGAVGRHRRWAAGLAVATVTGLLLPALASSAQASAGPTRVTALVTQYTYFWREQDSNIGGSGVAPPTGPVPDPTVPSGDVAVAGPQGSDPGGASGPEKETYLEYDVSAIPPGSRILSFVITLPVDPAGQTVVPSGIPAPIIACAPQSSWQGGANTGQSFSGKPTDHCATSAPKVTTRNGGRTYTAQIASIAQGWVAVGGLNLGVAITDDPHNSTTAYQVVFGPPKALRDLTAQVTYVPAAGGTTHDTQVSGRTAAGATGAAPTSDAGAGGGTVSSQLPISSPSASSPSGSGSGGSGVRSPIVFATPSTSTTAPVATPGAGQPRRGVMLAAASSLPQPGFYLAAGLLLLLLLGSSLVLGDAGAAVRAAPKRGVGRALARPRAGGPARPDGPGGHV